MSNRNDLLEAILAKIGGVPAGQENYYVETARFEENTSQPGPLLDALAVVTLGPGGTDPDGILTIAANGEVTVNKSGPVMIKQNFELAKQSNPGAIEAFFLAQVSIDGGANWLPLGSAANRRISSNDTVNVFFDISPVFLTAGTMIRSVWSESSVGGDPASPTTGIADGSLLYAEPSAALQALGMMSAPSAIAVLYKLNGYNYV